MGDKKQVEIEKKKRAHVATGKPKGRPPTKKPIIQKPKEEKPQADTQAETLELDKPAEKKDEKETYKCAGCKTDLAKGQKFCPSCGVHLDWGV